ncbi:outer surface protein C (plasmid) [Candidatus Borrelia fainii]|uniref:Outer surface protein C n=1 Tax=Candidatus Borrelia fainii TaxID=2518322 RepID=A0ABM8DLV2_9SPIR|nr:Vsp/OspC family lipoprotein [Candidatus Borrelia fainii]BDU63522.1 outer surface protein C [Candidatus Borrelia fainii]
MKRITLSALLMTLFLFIGCNNGGVKEGEATTSNGSVINLKEVSTDIKNAVAFAASVKEVRILVKSIDELADAIGKKIQNDGATGTVASKNASLVAGAYKVVAAVETGLGELEKTVGLSEELKKKVTAAKSSSTKFLTTLKGATGEIGQDDTTDANAKKAILKSDATGDKGAKDLIALNTAIDALVDAANAAVTSAIKALTTPVKAEKNQLENN